MWELINYSCFIFGSTEFLLSSPSFCSALYWIFLISNDYSCLILWSTLNLLNFKNFYSLYFFFVLLPISGLFCFLSFTDISLHWVVLVKTWTLSHETLHFISFQLSRPLLIVLWPDNCQLLECKCEVPLTLHWHFKEEHCYVLSRISAPYKSVILANVTGRYLRGQLLGFMLSFVQLWKKMSSF